MKPPLHFLFHPRSIAVMGASDRYGSVGRRVFSQLVINQCAPIIVPINPNHKTIGAQKAYETLHEAAVDYDFDVVVLVLSAEKIGNVVRDAAKAGIKNLIIINEIDPYLSTSRSKLERASERAKKAKIQLFAVPASGLLGLFRQPEHTAIAYIGQSAGIADCMASYAAERGIVFSRFITLTPQNYPVSTGKIVDYVAAEETTSALLVHISVLDNPRELVSALMAAARRKPVVVLTTLTDDGQEILFAQALERAHILSAQTLTQFFTAAKLIHTGMISRGKHVGIISNTPQITALSLKTLEHTELVLAEPTNSTTRALAKIATHKPPSYNPLYLPADTAPGVFQAAVSHYLNDENTDAVCLIYAGLNAADSHQVAQLIATLQHDSRKPLLLVWLGSADTIKTRQWFNQHKNLHFRQPEHALHALSQLNIYHRHMQQRHRASVFHDYRYASAIAKDLHQHIRPFVPVAVLPASKNGLNYFLAALHLRHQPGIKKSSDTLQLGWEKHEVFGQVLTLLSHNCSIKLLPPVTPEIIENTLNQLGLPNLIWQDWLLNCVDILCRLPEIHSTFLTLLHNIEQGIICSDAKLNLQALDALPDSVSDNLFNSFSGSPNIFAPYPMHLECAIVLPNGTSAWLRPVRPEDASLIQRLISEQSEQSRYTRFMSKSQDIAPALLSRLSQPDYQREFALLLHDEEQNPLAHASYTADANGISCEFGIIVADSLHKQGVGVMLMRELITNARLQGFAQIRAEILADNHPMQKLALKLGFILAQHPEDSSLVEAKLEL